MIAAPRQHLPRGEDFLLLPPSIQPYAYRIVDRLFAHRVVKAGPSPRVLPRGDEIAPRYVADGREYDVGSFMDRNTIVGLLVIRHGKVVLERYGLGLQEHDRWSTMSTVKSMTAMLVGAAVRDGAIKLIDELLKRGKPFEFELYPGEVHFFGRRRSWVDAFAKMERFFAGYLHPET